jgi:hypothetical protein
MSSMNLSHDVTGPGTQRTDQASAAAELAALKAGIAREEARLRAKYTGWKPLTIWYTLWALLFGFASVSALLAGQPAVFLAGALFTGLACLYARYLYRGGRYRVWFVVF